MTTVGSSWRDDPRFFTIAARAYAARIMWRRGVVLLKHKHGLEPWERTFYAFIEMWLERQRLAELIERHERRHGRRQTRKKGRPRAALRSPVNLRYVARRLKAQYLNLTYRQIVVCLVDDIAWRLPVRWRKALLSAADGADRKHIKATMRRDLLRSRDDKIDPVLLR
jgi:hypothetical protein